MFKRLSVLLVAIAFAWSPVSLANKAERIGSVDTAFKLFGPNQKIVIEVFDDPDISGISCYLSRPVTGGVKGALGIAEDRAHASIACKQLGKIHYQKPLEQGEKVFSVRTSLVFKHQKVVRFFDKKRHALVYLTYSTKLVDGSYKSALSVVPIRPWSGDADE
ncbi:CreA family protein [Dongshaea marina]|uniref:CreA family protein n=1 Tax=Dongshaea marina TaxID=2047966 RepID=UPI000D3E05E7|nr:CreA family protein [Dongshaea marina]